MDRKILYRKLFTVVTPIAFQYLMASLVTASDAFMLGFLDQESLAASSLAGQIAFVFSLFFNAFVFGLTVLAAQYSTGAKVTEGLLKRFWPLPCGIACWWD